MTSTTRSSCWSPPACPRRRRRRSAPAQFGTRSSSPAGYSRDRRPPGRSGTLPIRRPCRSACDGVDRWVRTPAPTLGQHNHEILADRSALTDRRRPEIGTGRTRSRGSIDDTPRSDCEQRSERPTCSTAIAVIDVDTHLTEPPDVWTARMPAAMHDVVPHIERIDGQRRLDGRRRAPRRARLLLDGRVRRRDARCRSRRPTTRSRRRCTTRRRGCSSSTSRASSAQVLYPNVGGFGNGYFLRLGDRELVRAVRAGLQRLPHRLVQRRPRPAGRRSPRSPFWDVDLAVAELAALHRATATARSTSATSRRTTASRRSPHPHWDPIWAAAQEAGVLGQLPRRWRLDGHAVRRHRRAWAG